MKIATFNINDINRRLPNLLSWLKSAKPDIVCLQELIADQGNFPAEALEKAGYDSVWKGQKTWNGVAILARGQDIHVTQNSLPGDTSDKQSQYIETAINAYSTFVLGVICQVLSKFTASRNRAEA